MSRKPTIPLLVSYSGQGGVEVVTNNLCQGLLNQGYQVDLLMVKCRGPHAKNIPEGVNAIKFKMNSTWLCLPELITYLWTKKPKVLLAAKHRGVALAVTAKAFTSAETKIIGQIHTNTSATFEQKNHRQREQRFREMRKYYPQLDAIIGVSQGVVEDIKQVIGQAMPKMHKALPNALFDERIYQNAEQPVDHAWLNDRKHPVLMAAGRLTAQKDFTTLVRAFAIANQQRPLRLIIIGEGEQKTALMELAKQLGVESSLDFQPFQTNLPAWLAKADCFVCSSAWEGLGNVVAESLAVGTPIVSTDCQSGPRDILEDGALGPLVAVGDAEALGRAIIERLNADWPDYSQQAKASAQRFHLDESAVQYLQFFKQVSEA